MRTDACFALCRVANELATVVGVDGSGLGPTSSSSIATSSHHLHQHHGGSVATASSPNSVLIPLFWQLYSSPMSRGLVRQNDFSHLQSYFLQKAIIRAVASLRVQQVCPRDVINFLVELNRYNDNSRNPYSDCYYRAEIIKAMKDTLTPAIVMRGVASVSSLPQEVRTVVEEVSRCMNLDTQIPSYKLSVTVACLLAIRRLQKFGFLPVEAGLFYKMASPGRYSQVRLAAIKCLVDYVRGERDPAALEWLFDEIIEKDSSYPRIRYETVRLLIATPPFGRNETSSRLDTPQLVHRLWALMNFGCAGDARLRCAVADLYYSLYGIRRPLCLPLEAGVMLVRVRERRSMVRVAERDASTLLTSSSGADPWDKGEGLSDSENYRQHPQSIDESSTPPPAKRRMEHLSDDDDDFICVGLVLLI